MASCMGSLLEALEVDDLGRAVQAGLLNVFDFEGIKVVKVKRRVGGFSEGTVLVVGRGSCTVLKPLPKLILAASPGHASRLVKGAVVLEEHVPGVRVRIASVDGIVVAVTPDGAPCPYLSSRLDRMYGPSIRGALESLGENSYLVGVVTGLENPYYPYYYHHDFPRFELLVTDVVAKGRVLSIDERTAVVVEHGLKGITVYGSPDPSMLRKALDEALKSVEMRGGCGIEIRDEDHELRRIVLLTTHSLQARIRELLSDPTRGWSNALALILLEVLGLLLEGTTKVKLESRAFEVGLSLFDGLMDLAAKTLSSKRCCFELELRFRDEEALQLFLTHAAKRGLGVSLTSKRRDGEEIVGIFKKCFDGFQRLLEEVLSRGLELE